MAELVPVVDLVVPPEGRGMSLPRPAESLALYASSGVMMTSSSSGIGCGLAIFSSRGSNSPVCKHVIVLLYSRAWVVPVRKHDQIRIRVDPQFHPYFHLFS